MRRAAWFANQRREWIMEALRVYGFINRSHIMKKFGVSIAAASLDLRAYVKANPRAAVYDTSLKCWRARR